MEDLLSHPEKAKRIADNSVRVFRERYLTPAAEACYWRELVKVWSEVSFEPVLYEGPGEDEGDSKKHKKQKKMAPKGRRRGVRYETFM